MEVNEPSNERSVQHEDTTFWVDAKPEPVDDRIWTDYWVAEKDGETVAEGMPFWYYRWFTRIFYGWKWRKV